MQAHHPIKLDGLDQDTVTHLRDVFARELHVWRDVDQGDPEDVAMGERYRPLISGAIEGLAHGRLEIADGAYGRSTLEHYAHEMWTRDLPMTRSLLGVLEITGSYNDFDWPRG